MEKNHFGPNDARAPDERKRSRYRRDGRVETRLSMFSVSCLVRLTNGVVVNRIYIL